MRFTINKEYFAKGLQTAGCAIGGKSPNNILLYFKLELDPEGLSITSSNGDMAIFTKIPNTIDGREVIRNASYGSTLVLGKSFSDLIKSFDNDEILFEVLDDVVVSISDGKSTSKISCLDAMEYPDVTFEKLNPGFAVLGADLARMVAQTGFAALAKDGRPILKTINFKAEAGRLVATATDGARLSEKEMVIDSDARFSVNVTAKTIADVCRLFDPGDTVTVSASPDRMIFEFGNTAIYLRLIPGDYPIAKSIIPTNFAAHLTVDANELLRALGRATILLVDNKVVKLSMSEDSVEISSREEQSGSSVERITMASYEGEPLDVTFNPTFLGEAVRALGGDDVRISFVGDQKPFVVRNPKDETIVTLITPVRTR